jgi:spore germination protein GerM
VPFMRKVICVLPLLLACAEQQDAPELDIPGDSIAQADSAGELRPSSQPASVNVSIELEAALRDLVRGPTQAERDAGAQSWFSEKTANAFKSVTMDAAGHAMVDFADLRPLIPNASSSAGSEMLLRELNAAVFAFPSVNSVEYRINGSCEDFGEWIQVGCKGYTRPVK